MKHLLLLVLVLAQFRGGLRGAPPAGPQSQLSQTVSAAFREFSIDGTKYSDLHKKYLFVSGSAPNGAACGDWIPSDRVIPGSSLDRVLKAGRIRFGYTSRAPFHFKDSSGRSTGFEFELGNEIAERIRLHYGKPKLEAVWVEEHIQGPADGAARAIVDEMVRGLKANEFDVAFSGVNALAGATGVSPACPTLARFSTVLYTGKDHLDLKKVQNTDRRALLQFLKDHPSLSVISTAGGISDMTTSALAADLKAMGGTASISTNQTVLIARAVREKTVHFVIGDGIALSAFGLDRTFDGLDLHIDVRTVAGMPGITNMGALGPFTLKD